MLAYAACAALSRALMCLTRSEVVARAELEEARRLVGDLVATAQGRQVEALDTLVHVGQVLDAKFSSQTSLAQPIPALTITVLPYLSASKLRRL